MNLRPWERNISAQAGVWYICSGQATAFTVRLKPWLCRKRQRPAKVSGFIGCVCVPFSVGWRLVARRGKLHLGRKWHVDNACKWGTFAPFPTKAYPIRV